MDITYSRTALRSIKSLDSRVKDRIREGIEGIPYGDIKKIQGHSDLYRLRIGGYRVLFEIIGNEIYVNDVLPRGQAYKRV